MNQIIDRPTSRTRKQ